MHGLWSDLKLGLRTLVGRPGFSLVVVLALGVGIGANTAMFSLLNAALIQPLPFPEPDRLVLGYVAAPLSDNRTVATLVSVFAAVAVLLASLGLYGMLTFYVGQRTREIGVRMALGAAARELLTMVVRRGVKLVLIGLVLGIAGSWVAARFLDHLLFGVPATDPVTLLASAAVFATVGLLACLLPAWRATRIDPAISLSAE